MRSERAWSIFRRFRIVILVLCILISIACSAIFSIYCVRSWSVYELPERILMVGLAAGYGIGGVFLYLVAVVQFRLWIDAARILVYLLLTSSCATLFTFLGRMYPCTTGSTTCSRLSVLLIIGTWTLSGILLVYVCCLVAMSFIPQPRIPDATDAVSLMPSQRSSSQRLSVESSETLVPRRDSPSSKAYSDAESHHSLTRLSVKSGAPSQASSVTIAPPPYQDERNSTPFIRTQFPVTRPYPTPVFSPRTTRSRPLPLPNPFRDLDVHPTPSAGLHPSFPTTSHPRGEWKARTLSLSQKSASSLSHTSSSKPLPLTVRTQNPGGYARLEVQPLSASSGHLRAWGPASPGYYGEWYPYLTMPAMRSMSPSTQVVPDSIGAEGQWVTWHYSRHDIPRSASASVFSSPTVLGYK